MFQMGVSVLRGSFTLRIIVNRAFWFFDVTIADILSPQVTLSLSGIISIGEIVLRFRVVALRFMARGSSSESVSNILRDCYWMSSCGSESESWFQIAAWFSMACFSFLLVYIEVFKFLLHENLLF